AETFGIQALPVGFVNGLLLMGSPLLDEAGMRALVEAEIARSKRMMQEGIPRKDVYATLMKGAVTKRIAEVEAARKLREKQEAAKAGGEEAQLAHFVKPNPNYRYAVPSTGG